MAAMRRATTRENEGSTLGRRVFYPSSLGGMHDMPTVRELSLGFLDPETLSKCWSTSKSFCLDPAAFQNAERVVANLFALRREVWRRYLTSWVPECLCESEGWASKRLRRLRLGVVPKAIFTETLRRHLFHAGIRLVPWSMPGNRFWDQLEKKIAVCAAGSYPLHEWMTARGASVDWTPNDVDIFVAYNSEEEEGPSPLLLNDDDDDDDENPAPQFLVGGRDDDAEVTDTVAARKVFQEMVRRWCDRFQREVLKEEPRVDRDGTSLAEVARTRSEWYERLVEENRDTLPRVVVGGDDQEVDPTTTTTRGDAKCDFTIMEIRDFSLPDACVVNASAFEAQFPSSPSQKSRTVLQEACRSSAAPFPKYQHFFEALKLPVFSFILWRDLRRPGSRPPGLDRVVDSFDIDVCQVGIEGPPPAEDDAEAKATPWWTVVDAKTGTRLRTRDEAVANAIVQRKATVVRHYDAGRTLAREEKYAARGFNFAPLTGPASSSSS